MEHHHRLSAIAITLIATLLMMTTSIGRAQEKPTTTPESLSTAKFVELSEKLSEPGGYFDTDNLISNEASYLHVLGKMRDRKVNGGAFLGVGPDQSFSYIAQIRPRIAFMIDVRRDNLLMHLFYKALFTDSRNRLDFLCRLFGKPAPPNPAEWESRSIGELVDYLDKAPAEERLHTATTKAIRERILATGFKLGSAELATIERFHRAFFDGGLSLKFTSRNRAPRYYYPSYRDLILEKDLTGRQGSFLAREEDFRFLKSLEERNLVIPVVGNLAGERALRSIASYLRETGETVSAFYTSNVEFYLMRGDDFERFARNVATLPRNERSMIIRSFFNGNWGLAHRLNVSGYFSTQLLQTIDSFVKEFQSGGYQSYDDVVTRGIIE